MDQRTLSALEFDKVRGRLERHCTFSVALELARALEPSAELRVVDHAQRCTSEAVDLLAMVPDFAVRGARDIRALIQQARMGALLVPAQLLEVRDTVGAASRLHGSYRRVVDADTRFPELRELLVAVAEFPDLDALIARSVGPRGDVLDSASSELGRLRQAIRAAHDRLLERLNGLLQSGKYGSAIREAIVTMREGRYVIPVRADARGTVGGVVHDSSASGLTVFIEPLETIEAQNRWRQLQLDEAHEIERILRMLSTAVAADGDRLERTVSALAEVEFRLAKGRYSRELDATRPVLRAEPATSDPAPTSRPTTGIVLRRARHPLLPGPVVPITVALGDSLRVLVITGPNTGGKTVALKTVGLLVLMAQAGLHIPADPGSETSVFARVFADIGDEQSIEQSLSTFSSHLRAIVGAIEQLSSSSLVLLDEVGAGTDPSEGAALARAILTTLLDRGALAVATTHYAAMKSFAYATEGVENAAVEFDVATLSPTYRLIVGVPGRSYGLAIAARLGMPDEIVARARSYLSDDELQVDELLAAIQAERDAAQEERSRAGELRVAAEQLLRDAGVERDEAARRAESARDDAFAAVEAELAELRERLRRLARDRERVAANQEWMRAAEHTAGELREELRRARAKRAPATLRREMGEHLRPGDRVAIASLGQQGEVIAVLETGEAELQLGTFRLRRPITELRRIGRKEAGTATPRAPRDGDGGRRDVAAIPLDIDLRGMRALETEETLERYLNDAYLASLPFVRIIHGKGTGALRQSVREFVRNHPLVAGFESEADRQGGEGVTVVKLRDN